MSTTTALANLIAELLRERTALLMRHEDVAQFVADYDSSDVLQWTLEIAAPIVTYRDSPLDSIGN